MSAIKQKYFYLIMVLTMTLMVNQTAVNAQVTVFEEDFEGTDVINGAVVVGADFPKWTETANALNFTIDESTGLDIQAGFLGVLGASADETLISISFSFLGNTNNPTLEFDYELTDFMGFGSTPTLKVKYKSAVGDAWTVGATYNTLGKYTDVIVNLAGASADFYIAFEVTDAAGGAAISGTAIDNIKVTGEAAAGTPGLWTGATNTDWNTATNWDDGSVPDNTVNVQIQDVANQPIVGAAGGASADLTIDAGATMTVGSGRTLEIKGDVTNNAAATAIAGNGTIQINKGSGSQSLSAALTFGGTIAVLTSSTFATAGNLTISSGGAILHGTATTGGGGSVTGNVTVQQTGSASGSVYNFWSSPVASANTSVLGGTVYKYVETLNTADFNTEWETASETMTKGKGYATTGSATVSFAGVANDGNVDIAISYTGSATPAEDGWALVGNPYPSPISANSFIAGNGDILGTVYFWDDDNSGGSGYENSDYASWNGAGSVGGGGNTPNGNIAVGQGFFVQADGSAGTVHFTNSMRTVNASIFFKKSTQEKQSIRLSVVDSENNYNEALIVFMEDATDGYDRLYDGLKLKGNTNISLYSKLDDNDYAIQAFTSLDTSEKIIPIEIIATTEGEYKLNLTELVDVNSYLSVILEDRLLNSYYDFNEKAVYSFMASPGVIADRFYIHAKNSQTANAINSISGKSVRAYVSNSTLFIETSGKFSLNTIRLFDIQGKLIFEKVDSDHKPIKLHNVSEGIYILEVASEKELIRNKVIIN